MPKYAHFRIDTGEVLGWVDSDNFDAVLPDPAELIEVTTAEYAARQAGHWYVVQGALTKSAPAPAPTPLADLQAQACHAIDRAALALDEKYLTCGGQQSQIYARKVAQAQAFAAAGYPTLADPLQPTDPDYPLYGYVRAERGARRVADPMATDRQAADAIIGEAATYDSVGIPREDIRRTGKETVNACTAAKPLAPTQAEVDAVTAARDAAIAALHAL